MKTHVIVLFAAVSGLLIGLGASALVAKGAPQEGEAAEMQKQLDTLKHERVRTAQVAVAALGDAYQAGTTGLLDVLDAIDGLAEARLAVAATSPERIAALETWLAQLTALEQKIQALYKVGAHGGEIKELSTVTRERQSAEIALLESRLAALEAPGKPKREP